MGTEGLYLNVIKAVCDKSTANVILNGKKQSISAKIKNKTKMSTFTTVIQHGFGNPTWMYQKKKKSRLEK